MSKLCFVQPLKNSVSLPTAYTQHNLPNNYCLLFSNTQLSLFPSYWKQKFNILTAKSASLKLDALCRLCHFPPSSCLLCVATRPYMEFANKVVGEATQTDLSHRMESQAFVSSTPLLCITVFCISNTAALLLFLIYYIAIFIITSFANLLSECLPTLRTRCTGLATHSHPNSVQFTVARVNKNLHSLIPFTPKLSSWRFFFIFLRLE